MKMSRLIACCLALVLSDIAHAQLEITEIMYNPATPNENAWEWVEVRNTGGTNVDLAGYLAFNMGDNEVVSPNPTIDATHAQNTVVPAGGVAVIYDANYVSGSNPAGDPNNFNDQLFRDAWGLAPTVPLIGANFWPALSNTEGSPGQSIGFWVDATAYSMDVTPVEVSPGVFQNRVTSFANTTFSIEFSDAAFPAPDNMSSMTWTGNGSNQVGTNWVLSQTGVNGAVTSTQVLVDGFINSSSDVGNPGVAPQGSPLTSGLIITEMMANPASSEDNWEWVEIYNSSLATIDLSGYILDDDDGTALTMANITSGSVDPGETAVLFNIDDVTMTNFAAAWGASLNLIPVTDWNELAMANGGDVVMLKDTGGTTVASATYGGSSNGPSLTLAGLDLDPNDPLSWDNSADMDVYGSFPATLVSGGGQIPLHAGGDVGSPGSFTAVTGTPGDFDGDGDVDGRDFLEWQRGNSPNGTPGVSVSAADLADWQANYGAGPLVALGSVPEPTSLVILALALVPMACGRKR